MTKQEKDMVLEAIENGWVDRTFYYYQLFVDSKAQRPDTNIEWNDMVNELKAKATPKETKVK
jgi:hypothetical protein